MANKEVQRMCYSTGCCDHPQYFIFISLPGSVSNHSNRVLWR